MIPDIRLYIEAAIVGVLLLAIGAQTWRLHTRDAEIAAAISDNARLQAQADTLQSANADWAAKSETQSLAVQRLAALANSAAAEGQKRVAAVLGRPVRVPEGHGPSVLNAWYAQP